MREALAQRLGAIEEPRPVQDVTREMDSMDTLRGRRVRMAEGDGVEGKPGDPKSEPQQNPTNRLRGTERNMVRYSWFAR